MLWQQKPLMWHVPLWNHALLRFECGVSFEKNQLNDFSLLYQTLFLFLHHDTFPVTSFFISCHYKLNHMPFNFRAFKCSQVIQKVCYNLTLHNHHILFHSRQWNHDSDTECNAGYIILEQKEEFIMFQLQVVRYNFKQNAKSKVQCWQFQPNSPVYCRWYCMGH